MVGFMIGLLWVVYALSANFTQQFEKFQGVAGTNLKFFNESDLFWVTLFPSEVLKPYKKILIMGGLYGSLIESDIVYGVLDSIVTTENSKYQNIPKYLQIDFYPIPNHGVYRYSEKNENEKTIMSDLSLAEECNIPTAGINPDMNFKGSWKKQGKKCDPNFSGDNSMDSYVTKEIDYDTYDAIFNIQNSDKNFICGAFTSNQKDRPDLGDLSIVYDKAYLKAPDNYESGDCYDINKKELFGTLVDFASYQNKIFILQLSDKDQKLNEFSFIANVTSELLTGIDISAQSMVDESIDDGEYYSLIKWEFYLYNYDRKDSFVKVKTRLEFLYDIYNLTKIKVEIYDLELKDKKDEKIFENENGLEMTFSYNMSAYRAAKCIVYIDKYEDKNEIEFSANILLEIDNDDKFFKTYENTVGIALDDDKKEFLFSVIVILFMVLAFIISCCGVVTLVMENKPCNFFKTKCCCCCCKEENNDQEGRK